MKIKITKHTLIAQRNHRRHHHHPTFRPTISRNLRRFLDQGSFRPNLKGVSNRVNVKGIGLVQLIMMLVG